MRNIFKAGLLVVFLASTAIAQDAGVNPPQPMPATGEHGGFGLGVVLGEPTGLSAKGWLSDQTAIDAAAAWSFEGRDSFTVHGDFLWHNFDLIRVEHGQLPLYFGVGGRVRIKEDEHTRAGVRAPIGIAYLFEKVPVEVFVEVAPVLDITPRTQVELNGGVGARYYFR